MVHSRIWTRKQRLNIIIIVSNFSRSRFEKFAMLDWALSRGEMRKIIFCLTEAEQQCCHSKLFVFAKLELLSMKTRTIKINFLKNSFRNWCATLLFEAFSLNPFPSTWSVLIEVTKLSNAIVQKEKKEIQGLIITGSIQETLLNLSGRLNCILYNDDDRSTRSLSFLRLRERSLNLTTLRLAGSSKWHRATTFLYFSVNPRNKIRPNRAIIAHSRERRRPNGNSESSLEWKSQSFKVTSVDGREGESFAISISLFQSVESQNKLKQSKDSPETKIAVEKKKL